MHINIHEICIYDMRHYIYHIIDIYIYIRIYKGDYDIQRTPLDLPTNVNLSSFCNFTNIVLFNLTFGNETEVTMFLSATLPKNQPLARLAHEIGWVGRRSFPLRKAYFSWLVVSTILVKMDHFPNFRGENKTYLSCHHPVTYFQRGTC